MKRIEWGEEPVAYIPPKRCPTCSQVSHKQATHDDDDEPISRLGLLGAVVCAMVFWVVAGAAVWALLLGGGS